ncbi:MAG: PIN domain-containing protein [Acidobacteriota bacterium]
MRLTLDASVHLNALNPHEGGSIESQQLIAAIHGDIRLAHEIFVPMLLLVEVAASTARIFDDTDRGLEASEAIRHLPCQTFVPLDESLSNLSCELAATHRLRGADSIYGAVARRFDSLLVTRDREQLNRLGPSVRVCTPAAALEQLASVAETLPETAVDNTERQS